MVQTVDTIDVHAEHLHNEHARLCVERKGERLMLSLYAWVGDSLSCERIEGRIELLDSKIITCLQKLTELERQS
jgi:hypothetical protein